MDLLSLLFPTSCVGCNKAGDKYVCAECIGRSTRPWLVCPECKKPSPVGQTHDLCRTKTGLDGLIGIYKYRGTVKKAINALKYRGVTQVVTDLSDPCVVSLKNLPSIKSPIIVPIPIFRVRKNRRGFNQTELLAEALAQRLNWPYKKDVLVRISHTQPQVGLGLEERLRNICGEFAVNMNNLASITNLHESTVVLLDDVWTTGATLREACHSLKQSGVKNVWGVVIAR